MDQESAKTTIKVFSVLHYVSAGACLLLGILFFVAAPFLAQNDVFGDLAAIVSSMIAVFLIVNAVIDFLIGYGLWNMRPWGRILLLVIYWIALVFGILLAVASAVIAGDTLGAMMDIFVWVVFSAVIIWLFQFNDDIKAVFVSTGQPQVAVKNQ